MTAVSIEIAGQTFTIRRVVTGVRQLYAALVREQVEFLQRLDAYQKALKAGADEAAADGEDLARDVDAFYGRKLETFLRILELLLTRNGYEWDRRWWEDNAGEEDYRAFVLASINGEAPAGSKKKDAGGS